MKLEPRWVPSFVALLFVALFVRLGVWQIARYREAADDSANIRAAWAQPPVDALPNDTPGKVVHRRASLRGRWIDARSALIRGGLVDGVPGYHLVGVFQPDGGRPIVVDRGWIPVEIAPDAFAQLDKAPDGTLDGLLVAATGGDGLRPIRGPDGVERWPMETDLAYGVFHRVVGPPYGAIARAHTAAPVSEVALVVGPMLADEPERHLGPLPVPGYLLPLPRTHHLSYAAQWFGFALATIALWAWLSRKRGSA